MAVDIKVRWADNTPELVKNLKQGTGEIEATRASVDKLAQSLGGDKLITAAHRMVAAIGEIGGAEKLTNAERERTNALLDKALQKYQALGREAPDALRQVFEATKKVEDQTKKNETAWTSFVGKFDVKNAIEHPISAASEAMSAFGESIGGAGIAAAATVGAIGAVGLAMFNLAQKAAAVGGELNDMSEKTGMSVPALSKLSLAAQVAGTDLNAMTSALFKFEQNLAQGGEQFEKGLKRIGLSTEEVKAAGVDHYLDIVAEKMASTVDPTQRAAAAVELFGKQGKDIIPTLLKLNTALADVADITPWTTEQAADAEKFEMQMKSMLVHAEALGTGIGRELIPALSALASALKTIKDHVGFSILGVGLSDIKNAAGYIGALGGAGRLPGVPTGPVMPTNALKLPIEPGSVESALKELADEYGKIEAAQKKAAAAAEAYQRRLDEVNKKIQEATRDIGNLTEAQQEQVIALDNLGISTGDIAFKLGVSEVAVKRFIVAHDEMDAHIERLTQHIAAKAIPAFNGLILSWEQMLNTGKGLTVDGLIPLVKGFDDASRAELALKLYTDELTKSHVALQNQLARTIGLMPDFSQMAKEHMAEFGMESGHGFSDAFISVIDELPDTLRRALEGGGGFEGAAKSLGIKFADDFIKAYAEKMKAAGTPLTTAQNRAIGIGTVGGAAIGGAVGGAGGSLVGGLASSVGGSALAAAMPGLAGSIGGAIALGAATAGIGAAAVGIYALAKHFLAVSQAEKDARAALEKYQAQFGTLDDMIASVGAAYAVLGKTGVEAQRDLQNAFDASHRSAAEEAAALKIIDDNMKAAAEHTKNVSSAVDKLVEAGRAFGGTVPDAFKDAIKQIINMKGVTDEEKAALLALTKDVKPNFEDLTSRAAKFGITLEGLGKSFQQANIEARSKEIAGLFGELTKAGGDAGGILVGMADEISALVVDSKKFGTAIPENMRPLIEELLRAGKLVDANGDALTDLAGLSFEDTPLDESISSLTDAIKELIAALTGVPVEIDKINKKPIKIPINIETDPTAPPIFPSPLPDGVPSYAMGSGGFQDFGVGTLAVLHGREAVVTAAQATTITNNSSSPRTVVMQEHLSFNVTLPPEGTQRPDYVEKTLMPEIMKQLEDHRRGYTGRMRRALEVPS